MSGRPKIFEEEVVIARAAELFWRKGFEAASTEELLAAMGIGKGSFYLAFKGGKAELFEKVIDGLSRKELNLLNHTLATSQNKVETLKDLFRSIGLAPKERNQKGCFFGQTIAAFSSTDLPFTDLAARHLLQLEKIFYEVISEAQQDGTLSTKEAPALLAAHLITIWNGLGISRRMAPQPNSLSALIEMQLKILQ